MQNKNAIIGIGIAAVIILIGGYFLFANKTSKPSQVVPVVEEKVEVLTPEEIGLEVQVRSDSKAMKFTITKPNGITSVDYQISYTKEINGEEVPEGLIGQVEVTPGSDELGIKYREFGTCSSGTCRYDKVISDVKLTLKVVKDNKTYSVEKTIPL